MADENKKLEVTEEELRQLPRWAVVAFTARCARRAQPLFTMNWPQAPDEHVKAVEAAITLAESSARVGRANGSAAVVAAVAARAAATAAEDYPDAITAAADAAYYAASDAGRAATAVHDAAYAPTAAYYAAVAAGALAAVRIAATRADFELLQSLALIAEWSDESPVDPDLLGPLWPQGAPEGWPETPSCEDDIGGLQVEFEVPDGTSDEEALRLMDGYLSRLNTLHRAIGGKGLRISPPIEVMEPAGVTVGANP